MRRSVTRHCGESLEQMSARRNSLPNDAASDGGLNSLGIPRTVAGRSDPSIPRLRLRPSAARHGICVDSLHFVCNVWSVARRKRRWRLGAATGEPLAQQASTTALLLLDLQNEMVDEAGKIGAAGLARVAKERNVVENTRRGVEFARSAGHTIVHVRLGFRRDYLDAISVAPRIAKLKASGAAILGDWGTEFPAAIAPKDGELVVTKQCVNPFFGTGLLNWLSRKGVEHLVLCGVVTNLAVETTARAADDAGFRVTVLEDCCAAPNADWHRFSVTQILPLFGEISSSDRFCSAAPRADAPA